MQVGSGNTSLYIAVLVVFSGYIIWTTVNTFSRGLYRDAGIGVLISLTMVAMLLFVIRIAALAPPLIVIREPATGGEPAFQDCGRSPSGCGPRRRCRG